jgi:hypothetical protein
MKVTAAPHHNIDDKTAYIIKLEMKATKGILIYL